MNTLTRQRRRQTSSPRHSLNITSVALRGVLTIMLGVVLMSPWRSASACSQEPTPVSIVSDDSPDCLLVYSDEYGDSLTFENQCEGAITLITLEEIYGETEPRESAITIPVGESASVGTYRPMEQIEWVTADGSTGVVETERIYPASGNCPSSMLGCDAMATEPDSLFETSMFLMLLLGIGWRQRRARAMA